MLIIKNQIEFSEIILILDEVFDIYNYVRLYFEKLENPYVNLQVGQSKTIIDFLDKIDLFYEKQLPLIIESYSNRILNYNQVRYLSFLCRHQQNKIGNYTHLTPLKLITQSEEIRVGKDQKPFFIIEPSNGLDVLQIKDSKNNTILLNVYKTHIKNLTVELQKRLNYILSNNEETIPDHSSKNEFTYKLKGFSMLKSLPESQLAEIWQIIDDNKVFECSISEFSRLFNDKGLKRSIIVNSRKLGYLQALIIALENNAFLTQKNELTRISELFSYNGKPVEKSQIIKGHLHSDSRRRFSEILKNQSI